MPEEYLEARRVEILRAAGACFAEHGFRATHMRDVARRAGLSTGAVYRYFPGKEELFKALLERERPIETSSRDTLLAGNTPFEQLEGLLEKLARRGPESETRNRKNFRDYGEAAQTPFLAQELGKGVAEVVGLVEGVILAGQEEGDFDPALDARAVATLLATQSVGLGFVQLFGGEYNIDTVVEVLHRLLRGLRP